MTVTAGPALRRRPASAELFVATAHKVRDRDGIPPLGWLPYGVQHAWRPGTRTTLCGEPTVGWDVFWEMHFTAQRPESCRACVEASLPADSRRRLAPMPVNRPAL